MTVHTAQSVLRAIEQLSPEHRELLFEQLTVTAPRMTGGRYQVLHDRPARLLQGFIRYFMARRPDLIPAELMDLVRDSLSLAEITARHADAARELAAEALAKIERRRRKPDRQTAVIYAWVHEKVEARRATGGKPDWSQLVDEVRAQFQKKYEPGSLRAGHCRYVKSLTR